MARLSLSILALSLVACVSDEAAPRTTGTPSGQPGAAVDVATFTATVNGSEVRFEVEPVPTQKDSLCELRVTSGRPDTVTLATRLVASTPSDCGLPEEPPFSSLGVYCVDVEIINNYDQPLPELVAHITRVEPSLGTLPWRAPWVDDQEPGPLTPESVYGEFHYGDVEAEGSGAQLWRFQHSGGAFSFQGKIRTHFAEIPDNRLDDDCDGLVDEP